MYFSKSFNYNVKNIAWSSHILIWDFEFDVKNHYAMKRKIKQCHDGQQFQQYQPNGQLFCKYQTKLSTISPIMAISTKQLFHQYQPNGQLFCKYQPNG